MTTERRAITRAELLMAIAALAGAAMGASAYALRGSCDWRLVLFCRTCVGLVVALVFCRIRGIAFPWRAPGALWVRSITGGGAILCTFYALTHLPTGEAIVLMSTAPLFVALISVIVLGHRPGPRVWVALAVGLLGIALVQRPGRAMLQLGALAALGTAVGIAIATHSGSQLRHRLTAAAIVAHYSLVSVLTSGLLVLGSLRRLEVRALVGSSRTLLLLAVVGGLGALCQIAATTATSAGNVARLTAISYTQIVWALVFDAVLVGTSVGGLGGLGVALIVVPLLWMLWHPTEVRHLSARAVVSGAMDELLDEGRQAVEEAIAAAERCTSCEFRVHLDRQGAGAPAEEAARHFESLGMKATQRRNGVLLYVALEPAAFAIVADVGVSEIVPARTFDQIANVVVKRMQTRDTTGALHEGIMALGTTLGHLFPRTEDDVDELPNSISFSAS